MRILYICGDLGVEVSGRKGAATHVRETCHALQRFGHEVLLVTPRVGDRAQIRVPVLEISAPSARWLGADLRYVLLNARMRRALPRVVRDFKPDAVYERYALYQTAGQDLCKRMGLPRILEVNTLLASELGHRLRFPFFARMVENALWRGETAIICVSSTLKTEMIAQAGLDVNRMRGFIVSPVGVDPEQFSPNVPPLDRTMLGCQGNKIVGYVGTLTTWHGVQLFFDAARLLAQQASRVCLVVVGGEPERVVRLRARAEREGLTHLHFVGSVPHEQVPRWLAMMDVCLIADSQDWSSPTKYFEMAATAKPVLAARVPAIEEVFGGDGVGGILFERGNPRDLVEKLLHLLEHPDVARTLGQQARQRVLENYTWEHNIERIMRLYEKLGVRNAHMAAAAQAPHEGSR